MHVDFVLMMTFIAHETYMCMWSMCLLGGKSGYGGKGYYMRRGKSYYKKGEIWLYSRISPGERLLYSQFSGGKATI